MGRQSKALERSIKMAAICLFSSRDLRQSSKRSSRVDWHPKPALKAANKGLKISLKKSTTGHAEFVQKVLIW